jgi:hypothetical protein
MKLSSLFSPSSKLMKALQNKDYERRKHATIELEKVVQGLSLFSSRAQSL